MTDLVRDFDVMKDALPDLHDRTRALREAGRMSFVKIQGAPAPILTHYEDVMEAYRDEENFPSAAAYNVIAGPVMGKTIQCMTGDEHRLHRELVRSAFKPSVARDYVPTVFNGVADELVDRFVSQGRAELVEDFTKRFSFGIIAQVIGITDVDNDQLHHWVSGLFGFPTDPEGALRTTKEFNQYMTSQLDQRRREPREDLLTKLLQAEIEGQKLDDEQILSFVRLLFPAGADTTFLSTGSMLVYLLRNPGVLERIRAQPEDRAAAIEESLRIEPPVTIQTRVNPQAIHWRGLEIPAGPLLFGTSAANRDPEYFPDPDRFDIDRFGTGRKDRHPIASFGQGRHFCLGSHFARGEMQAALDVLLERLPNLRLVDDESVRIEGGVMRGPNRIPVAFDV
jgi:cytochrome P450